MNKREKIKRLKADNKIVYKTLEKYLDALVAVEMALNPDNPFMAPGYPTPAQQVKDLLQEKKDLLAEMGIMTGRDAQRQLFTGRAIERAAELPDRMSLLVEAERYSASATVYLFIHGRLVPAEEFHGETLGEEINAAIDYALAVAQEQGQQA